MYNQVMQICSQGIGAVMGWFNTLIPEDFKSLILGMFAMFVVYGTIIRPLMNGAGSDSVRRKTKGGAEK